MSGYTYDKRKTPTARPDEASFAPAEQSRQSMSNAAVLQASHASAPQRMSSALRERFEPGFGANFENIRISRGYIPPELGIQAVARGTDILLDRSADNAVLGHELAHVVQQASGRVGGGYPVVNSPTLEHEADVQGRTVANGGMLEGGMSMGLGLSEFGSAQTLMPIAPMSGATAPAQCKSKAEKKMDKAEKKLQKGMKGDNPQKSKDDYSESMRQIVRGMSEKDVHNPKIQQRLVSYAGSHINAGLKKHKGTEDWEKYATDLRGSEYQYSQAGMNEMMIRLMGGRDQLRSSVKGKTPEAALGDMTTSIENNEEVSGMLRSFSDQVMDGVNQGAMANQEARDMAIMNNFMTRNVGLAMVPTRDETSRGIATDREAMKAGHDMQVLVRADPKTGKHAVSNSDSGKRMVGLLGRLRGRQNAPPVPARGGTSTPSQPSVPQPQQSSENLDFMYKQAVTLYSNYNNTGLLLTTARQMPPGCEQRRKLFELAGIPDED